MVDCFLWEFEEQIVLNYYEEDDPSTLDEANRCLKALKELEPIIQALSVEFRVECRHLKRLAYSFEIKPEIEFWHWELSPVPPNISTFGFYTGIAKIIPVENITTEDLSQWIIEPLQQKSPDPEYDVRWSEINICATRAKVINEITIDEIHCVGRDYYLVKTEIGEIKYPLIEHDGGLWVYGPQKVYDGYPPMSIRIYTDGGTHKIKFLIPWTVWYDENSPEYYYFYQAVQRIIAQGWELSEQTPMKEPKYTDKGKLKLGSIDNHTEIPKLGSLVEQLNKSLTLQKQSSTEKTELNGKIEPIPKPEPPVQESPNLEQQQQEKQEKLELVKTRLAKIDVEKKRLNERIKNLSGGNYNPSLHSRIKELKAKISKLIGDKSQLERKKADLEQEIGKMNRDIDEDKN